MSIRASPAFNVAPDTVAAHRSKMRILIGSWFLYTYTQMQPPVTRRRFLRASTLAPAAISLKAAPAVATPAILGGSKAHPTPFPSWPVFDQSEERAVLDTLRSGQWYRGSGKRVDRFQQAYAD